ncbi:MAG: hypothetical protein ACYS8W_16590, partial [Planctomycetota bacterium]
MKRAIFLVIVGLVLGLCAYGAYTGEVVPSGETPGNAPPENPDTEKPEGHGEIASDIEGGNIVLVSVDSGLEFRENDRLLVLTGSPDVSYMVVSKAMEAGNQSAMCMCKVEKGAEFIIKGMRIVNIRIRNAESPPGELQNDEDKTGKTGTEAVDSEQVSALNRKILMLKAEVKVLRDRIETLEQKYQNLDLRLVSLERSRPDTSVNLPKGLKPGASGRVIVVRGDGKVAVSIGNEVGIR